MKKRKKGKHLLTVLFAVIGLITGASAYGETVWAAENTSYLDFNTSQNLWNVGQSWDSINTGTTLVNVETGGFTERTDTTEYTYVEAPGILGYPDTTSWIRATYN